MELDQKRKAVPAAEPPPRVGNRAFGVGAATIGTHTVAGMFADHVLSRHEADAGRLIAQAPAEAVHLFSNSERFGVLNKLDPQYLCVTIVRVWGNLTEQFLPEQSIAAAVAALTSPATTSR